MCLTFPLSLAAFCVMLCALSPCATASSDAALCQQATASAERLSGVPDQLLDAISRVESGRYDDDTGAIRAWPWTINEEGQGHFYRTKSEAVQAARDFRARGVQSMDVGCTQINLMYHPDAFASLEDAFDPSHNAAYAARFLTDLFHQVGSWPHAAAAYHSQTPELGTDYQRKVLEAWADPIGGPGASSSSGRMALSHSTDFHRQLAALSAGPASAGASGAMSGLPIARPLGASVTGFSQIQHSGANRFAFSGRTLSAYRAMPVAMLTVRHPLARY